MTKKTLAGIFTLIFMLIGIMGLKMVQANETTDLRRIVIFEANVNEPAKNALLEKVGAKSPKNLPIINGKAVILPSRAAERALQNQAGVVRIDEDIVVKAASKLKFDAAQPSQSTPWGISRVKADQVWDQATGNAVKVAVIDTGIDKTHPDLRANLKGGALLISTDQYSKKPINAWDDDTGHGTHVAGTIAAVGNSIGVIGVAPQAHLYGVKVLDSWGYGYVSDIIAGLQWSITNEMDVINMSLDTPYNVQSFHDAVKAVYNAGIVQIAAAGNSGPYSNSVTYPGRYPETIAVAASGMNFDGSDYIAFFSSRGPEIDITAPGFNVLSTFMGGTYMPLLGTSMAAPHVSGVAAQLLQKNPLLMPEEIKSRIKETAGDLGFDATLQGSGIVDAKAALPVLVP